MDCILVLGKPKRRCGELGVRYELDQGSIRKGGLLTGALTSRINAESPAILTALRRLLQRQPSSSSSSRVRKEDMGLFGYDFY